MSTLTEVVPAPADAAGTRVVEHVVEVDAPVERVWRLIADATEWPLFFPPSVHVERSLLERSAGGVETERLAIWATANGEVKHWTSRRRLDPAARAITFRQERSVAPVASMGGEWTFEELPGGRTRVLLQHDFRAVDDDPEGLAWIERAVDTNSTAELAGLARLAVRAGSDELRLDFEDAVQVTGSAQDVYDFLDAARLWPQRLGHVAAVELIETVPGQQVLRMDTRAVDGSVHTTESVRICTPVERIVYKQTKVPALMTAHTGRWAVITDGDVVRASSQHTVLLNPDAVTAVLGPDATIDTAREFVHRALSTNSMLTLTHAKRFAEQRATAGPLDQP